MTEWLTVNEAVAYLRISRATLYAWMKAGQVPYYTGPRGRRRLKREDLDAAHRQASGPGEYGGGPS